MRRAFAFFIAKFAVAAESFSAAIQEKDDAAVALAPPHSPSSADINGRAV